MASRTLSIAILILAATAVVLVQQQEADVEIVGHVVKPEPLSAPVQVSQLTAPPEFAVTMFAENLGKPRMLAVAADGTVYVTRREPGDVVALTDTNGDGSADETRVAVRRPMLHGIALDGRKAYLVGVNDVFSADIQPDHTFANVVRIVHDLPEAGQHPNRTIAVGPDKHLYVSVGSTCNACDETSPEHATVLRISPDGKSRQIFASGLGPRPPENDPAHHYHFQVFALDTVLTVPPGATRDAHIAAMHGHVLARGAGRHVPPGE
jgi:glucose/arabinose dehydrogenase